jgi:hypothetical protein
MPCWFHQVGKRRETDRSQEVVLMMRRLSDKRYRGRYCAKLGRKRQESAMMDHGHHTGRHDRGVDHRRA